jgi:predicted chitinase
MSKYSFDQYKLIFEGAIKKYEGNTFFRSLIDQRGQPAFPSEPGEVAIVGIRHAGARKQGRDDVANDTVALIYIDDQGNKKGIEYVGTTEPGFFEGGNAQGVFTLSPGFYWFKLGKHHGVNPCLVQDCAVIGERAKLGAEINETDEVTWKITDGSLHIHAGIKNLQHVGNWSAGCTVIAGGWEGKAWAEFFGVCRKATNFPIPYVLVKEADVPALLSPQTNGATGATGANGSNGANGANGSSASTTVSDVAVKEAGTDDFTVPAKSEVDTILPQAAAAAQQAAPSRFNHEAFWGEYRKGLKTLGEGVQQAEVEHVENILNRASGDARIRNLSQLAYMMTTARWETDRFRALYERGSDKYLSQYQGKGGNTRPGDYKRYRGTGYVHLTFRDNFRNAGLKLGAPLEDNPALAADQHWAYEIMVRGHLEGWFTAKKLGDYVNDSTRDFRNARKVINPGELKIADNARAIPPASRTPRQKQCVEALDTQVEWAGMIERCLKAAEAAASPVPEAAPPDAVEGEEPSEELRVLKPSPEELTESAPALGAGDAAQTQTPAPAPQAGVVQASTGSVKRRNATIGAALVAAAAGVKGLVVDNPVISTVIILSVLGAVIWLVTWYIHVQRDLDKKRMEIAADPSNNKVR